MEDLKNIIKEIKSYEDISPDDNTVLEVASKIFISQNIQRERRGERKISDSRASNQSIEPITEKQRNLLKKLGYKGDFNMTKKEARILIDNRIKEIGRTNATI